MRTIYFILLVLGVGGSGCASTDARCVSLCRDDGVGDRFCSADSISSCLATCQARVDGVRSVCATCLLEGARFGSPGGPIELCLSDASCPESSLCMGAVCSYCADDPAERARCNPPTEVDCEPSFRASTECASVCTAG